MERRMRWGIPLDWKDLPVSPFYLQQLEAVEGCYIHHATKWFNAATVVITDVANESQVLESINALPFVVEVKTQRQPSSTTTLENKWNFSFTDLRTENTEQTLEEQYVEFYGPSFRQVSMINAHVLHEMGFTGEGIDVAMMDSGWEYTDALPAFDRLRERNAIRMTRDFVNGGTNVYTESTHGTYVLSTMAAWIPDSLIGTAPDANYYFFRTEDVATEYRIEEDNWVVAAELADSLGVDIINSSLGYSEFDDASMNYTYADMNGEVSRASMAGDIAASKGILVVNSAGNRGHQAWRYITAPSDGDSVLCVGAVNINENRAWFSGFGPSSDGNVKPNVMAMGQATVFADLDSTIRTGNGTSFSSPIMAGGAACLMQAVNGRKTNMDVFRAIEKSADHYSNPSDSLGYGIPDLWKALQLLNEEWSEIFAENLIAVFPNPTTNQLTISTEWLQDKSKANCKIYDMLGREVKQDEYMVSADVARSVLTIQWRVGQLSPGNYILSVTTDKEKRMAKFSVR